MTTTNQYIARGRIQTALLKSIPYFKYWYEQSNIKYKLGILGDTFGWNNSARKLLEAMNTHAKRLYSVFTREELEKLLRVRRIPAGATLLIFEQLRIPIIAYNLEHLPQNVVGWVSHSMPGDNIKRAVHEGTICYNIEILKRRKTIFSDRYMQNPDEKRIREGISLAYQYTGKYLSYAIKGGTWIFPITSILSGDLILDFRNTMDQLPEAVLRNEASYKDATILRELEYAIREITTWEQKIPIAQYVFTSTKEINAEEIGKPYFWEEKIPKLEKLRAQKRFFAFTYLMQGTEYSSLQEIVPKLYTFAKGTSPTYLNNTFFSDVNRYYIPGLDRQYPIAHYIILQLLLEDKYKNNDFTTYANILDTLSPKDLIKITARTKRSLIQTMGKVIEFAQQGTTPCCIDITKGVLLLDMEYHDDEILQKIIERKIPVFELFPNFKSWETPQFIDQFIDEVLDMKRRDDKITTNNYYVKERETVQLREWK